MYFTNFIQGLFHQAIMHSGCDMNLWSVNEPEQHPENYLKFVADEVNCPNEDNEEMLQCLQSRTARSIVNAEFNCTVIYYGLIT